LASSTGGVLMEPEQESSRSATKADMLQIIDALETRGVDYILIGGHALQLHGYMRATEDVDFLLPLDEINGSKVIDALSILPDRASLEMESSWFAEGENIRVNDEIIVDLLFVAANGETYESLSGHIIDVEIDGHAIKTLDLEGLLKTKVSTREKDIADYRVLALAIREINRTKALDADSSSVNEAGKSLPVHHYTGLLKSYDADKGTLVLQQGNYSYPYDAATRLDVKPGQRVQIDVLKDGEKNRVIGARVPSQEQHPEPGRKKGDLEI
jgi:hypothetical protein